VVFNFDYLSRSGNKCMKESFDAVMTNGVIPVSFMPTIGRLITLKYATKWNGIYRQSERMYSEQFDMLKTEDITTSRSLSSTSNSETEATAKQFSASTADEKRTADETAGRAMNDAMNKTEERTGNDERTLDRQYDETRASSESESRSSSEDISGTETHAGTESESGSKTRTKSGSVVDSGSASTELLEKVDGNTVTATERTASDTVSLSDSVSSSNSYAANDYTFGFNSSSPVETGRGHNSQSATEDRDQAQKSNNNFTEEGAENKSSSTDKSENKTDTHVQTFDGYSEVETPNTQVTKTNSVANESAMEFSGDSSKESSETHTNKGAESEQNNTTESVFGNIVRSVDETTTRQNNEGKTKSASESGETSETGTAKQFSASTEDKTVSGYRNLDAPDAMARVFELMKGFNLLDIVYDDIDEILVSNIFVA